MDNNAWTRFSSRNPTDHFSALGSPYPSPVSTPQPISEGQQLFVGHGSFDVRYQLAHPLELGLANVTNSETPHPVYSANYSSMCQQETSVGQPSSYMLPKPTDIEPKYPDQWQEIEAEPKLRSINSTTALRDIMFTIDGDLDIKREEGTALGYRSLVALHDFSRSPSEESYIDSGGAGGELASDCSFPEQFKPLAGRDRINPPTICATFDETAPERVSFCVECDGSCISLGETLACTASAAELDSNWNRNDYEEEILQPDSRTYEVPVTHGNGSFDNPTNYSSYSSLDISWPTNNVDSSAPSRPGRRRTKVSSTDLANSTATGIGSPIICTNCSTQVTPLWRRTREGDPMCNACGLFFKVNGVHRPLSLKTDIIKKRIRGSAGSSPPNGRGASTRGAKEN